MAADMQVVKKYLARVRYIDTEIKASESIARSLREKVRSVQPSKLKDISVQESKLETAEDRIMKYMAIEERINILINGKIDLKDTVLAEISLMDSSVSKTMLMRRYIISQSWDEIAEEMNYSKQHITRLHGSALQEFYQTNKESVDEWFKKEQEKLNKQES